MLWLNQCSIMLQKPCQSPVLQVHAQLAQCCTLLHAQLTGVKSRRVRWVVCLCGIDLPKAINTASYCLLCYLFLMWLCHKQRALISVSTARDLSNHPVHLYFIMFPLYFLHSYSVTCFVFIAHGMLCRLHFSSKMLLSHRQKKKKYMFAFLFLNWIFESFMKVYWRFNLGPVDEVLCGNTSSHEWRMND